MSEKLEIYQPKDAPSVEEVLGSNREVQQDEPVNEPMINNVEDVIITPKKNRIDFQSYELDNISQADTDNDVPNIKQVRDIAEEIESNKQDKLTAGDNITIENDVISATNTTYTAGSGLTLSGTEFQIDSISSSMLEDDSVTNSAIADNAVTTNEIADEAVTTAKIGDVQITADKIASNAITTDKVVDSNITNAKIKWDTIPSCLATTNATTDNVIAGVRKTVVFTDLVYNTGEFEINNDGNIVLPAGRYLIQPVIMLRASATGENTVVLRTHIAGTSDTLIGSSGFQNNITSISNIYSLTSPTIYEATEGQVLKTSVECNKNCEMVCSSLQTRLLINRIG